jgi:hypothetical protein
MTIPAIEFGGVDLRLTHPPLQDPWQPLQQWEKDYYTRSVLPSLENFSEFARNVQCADVGSLAYSIHARIVNTTRYFVRVLLSSNDKYYEITL